MQIQPYLSNVITTNFVNACWRLELETKPREVRSVTIMEKVPTDTSLAQCLKRFLNMKVSECSCFQPGEGPIIMH